MTIARSDPVPPALRILVLGQSTSLVVGRTRSTRAEGTFGQILERRLRQKGIDAQLVNESHPWRLINGVMPDAVRILGQHNPDVIIIFYGLGESQVYTSPTRMMLWLTMTRSGGTLNPLLRPVRDFIYGIVTSINGRSTRRLSRLLGRWTWRVGPKRFAAELTRLIQFSRLKSAGLVLAVTPHAPNTKMEGKMPGYTERSARYAGIVRDVVARVNDPDVRLIDAAAVVAKWGSDVATIDGLHYIAPVHEELAVLMEDEVVGWLASHEWDAPVRPASEVAPG